MTPAMMPPATTAPQDSQAPQRFTLRKPKNAQVSDEDFKKERSKILEDRFNRSHSWMRDNFYQDWARTYQKYMCHADAPQMDEGEEGWEWLRGGSGQNGPVIYDGSGRQVQGNNNDRGGLAITMPDIHALVRRKTARLTAQLPNLRYRGIDPSRSDRVGRTIMYQWDCGGIRQSDYKHVMQAVILGWSVRSWYWHNVEYDRVKRVNPLNIAPDSEDLMLLKEQYDGELFEILQRLVGDGTIGEEELTQPQLVDSMVLPVLAAEHGKGGLLEVQYSSRGYVGPKCDVLYPGDCYPMPDFQNIQDPEGWFMVVRRRGIDWLEDLGNIAQERGLEGMVANIKALYEKYPKGNETEFYQQHGALRRLMNNLTDKVAGRASDTHIGDEDDARWMIVEVHYPGRRNRVEYIGGGDFAHYLGEIESLYALEEGRIPFTELRLIDNLTHGIGDSTARAIRPLNELHDRQINITHETAYNVCRPLMWTTDEKLWDNPDSVRRGKGHRLILLDMPAERTLGILGEQAAMASVAVGLNSGTDIERQIQKATGENNLSMNAEVDPRANQTATGAKLSAFAQDTLNRSDLNMYNNGIRDDSNMMRMLNRAELDEDIRFDGSKYRRDIKDVLAKPGESGFDPNAAEFITATPEDFQEDGGEIEPEVGSTLADDDDSHITKANSLVALATQFGPQLVNMARARDVALTALGEGRSLDQWVPPPPPPPPGPETRSSLAVSIKWELLTPEEKLYFLQLLDAQGGVEGKITAEEVASASPPPPPKPSPALEEGMVEEGMEEGGGAEYEGERPMPDQAGAVASGEFPVEALQ